MLLTAALLSFVMAATGPGQPVAAPAPSQVIAGPRAQRDSASPSPFILRAARNESRARCEPGLPDWFTRGVWHWEAVAEHQGEEVWRIGWNLSNIVDLGATKLVQVAKQSFRGTPDAFVESFSVIVDCVAHTLSAWPIPDSAISTDAGRMHGLMNQACDPAQHERGNRALQSDGVSPHR